MPLWKEFFEAQARTEGENSVWRSDARGLCPVFCQEKENRLDGTTGTFFSCFKSGIGGKDGYCSKGLLGVTQNFQRVSEDLVEEGKA